MNRLLNNWKLKLFSLILAIGLWSHVRGEVNPWETAAFRVPLRGSAPSRLLVLNKDKIPREVRVTLRAPRSRLRELKGFAPPNPLAPEDAPILSTGDVRASLDFSLARLGAQDVPVKAQARVEDAEVIGVKPSVVVVLLDPAAEQQVAITPFLAPARGYRIEQVKLERSTATIFGPPKALAQVVGLRARVRSGPLALGVSRKIAVPLQAVDASGGKVFGVSVEPASLSAWAVLREETLQKEVALSARLVGVGPNIRVGEAQVLPARIQVRGPILEVEKIGSLRLHVDAAQLQPEGAWLQRRVDLELPPRVQAVGQGEVLVRAPLR